MYLLCSDWSIRSLEKEKEKEKEEENCHLLNTARRTDEGRDKNNFKIRAFGKNCAILTSLSSVYRLSALVLFFDLQWVRYELGINVAVKSKNKQICPNTLGLCDHK